MIFNSVEFLFWFLPIVYLVFWRLRTKGQRYAWLAATGYVFYGWWNWRFCFLMLASTLVSYLAGLGMLRWDGDARRRRLCCVVPIVVDLALLGFFKYAGFALESARSLAGALGHPLAVEPLSIVLPIGISFYTFHTISYVVDAHRRTIVPTRNFLEFACYVSLFAQLVAGPIVRFRQIEADLENLDHADRAAGWSRGWSFFALGLAKKVLLADSLAALTDPLLSPDMSLSTASAWLAILGYTYQLYFDFSGYSDMAVGLGHLFGLRLPQNFDSPYRALDPSDFWRRWHISLSTVLRDYLYVPLGGNRGGPLRMKRNLMLTMLLGGLWHGASWTFVVWGAYHGALLVLHRVLEPQVERVPAGLRRAGMFLLAVLGWVLFRATTFGMALSWFESLFTLRPGWPPLCGTFVALIGVAAGLAHLGPNTFELRHEWGPLRSLGLAALFFVSVLFVWGTAGSPFLYFQF